MKTILVDAVNAFVIKQDSSWIINQSLYKLLEEFPNKKIILTGASGENYIMYGLDKMPYEVFTLKHDPEKSDPRYYTTLLEKYNLKAEDIVYFEHNSDAVKSAESVGITTYWYDPEKKDLEALKKYLVETL